MGDATINKPTRRMTPEQEIYRANRAKEVLENEAYLEAFELIKTEIRNQWETSPARDIKGREALWLMQRLLDRLQATLGQTMQSGTLAAKTLEHRSTMERLRDFWREPSNVG